MTALHILCLNPNATLDMLKLLVTACPKSSTMEVNMISDMEIFHDDDMRYADEGHEMMTPAKLWLRMKTVSSYYDYDFNDEGKIKLKTALGKGLKWNDLPSLLYIQSAFPDCKEQDKETLLYPFMQAVLDGDTTLETVFHLALYDPHLIYESSCSRKKRRICQI